MRGWGFRRRLTPSGASSCLAALVRQWDAQRGGALNFAQSMALADSLARVMDEIERQGADLERLKDLLPDALAEHWQDVASFLNLIRDAWPAILQAEGRMNPAGTAQRGPRLDRRNPGEGASPQGMVIAAGSTRLHPRHGRADRRHRRNAERRGGVAGAGSRPGCGKLGPGLIPAIPSSA